MANYNPEPIEFAVMDYNPNQYNFGVAKSDGIYMGRKLMKDEVLRLIKAAYPQPTKAITIIIGSASLFTDVTKQSCFSY